jgi:hypothetical protein
MVKVGRWGEWELGLGNLEPRTPSPKEQIARDKCITCQPPFSCGTQNNKCDENNNNSLSQYQLISVSEAAIVCKTVEVLWNSNIFVSV